MVDDYLAVFTELKCEDEAARMAMTRRVLVDPVAHAVTFAVRKARGTAAPDDEAVMDAVVLIMNMFDAQKRQP